MTVLIHKAPKQPNIFLLLRSSDGLAQYYTIVYAQNSNIFYGAVHNPIAFLQL